MRRMLYLLLPLLALGALAGEEKLKWFQDLKPAKAEAERTGKPIFVITIWPPGL